jgi:hypothetical protein
MPSPAEDPNAAYERAHALRAQGRLDEALAIFDRLATQYPTVAAPRAFRGLTFCNLQRFEEGLADIRSALDAEPRNPDFHSNHGMVLFVLDRLDEARVALNRALVLMPRHPDALNNMSLVMRAQGDFAGSERAARKALEVRADFPQARVNLGYTLLALGKFAEAWPHHSFTPDPRITLRDPGIAPTMAHDDRLPPPDSPLVLHGEQGLGDTLFYLRFAPRLHAEGRRMAFWGDARLHAALLRTGLFEAMIAPEAFPAFPTVWVGDLPNFLEAGDPAAFPAPLPLTASEPRVQAMRDRLAAVGPAPYVGLTWKAGGSRPGKVVLAKSVPVEALGAALSGVTATFVSLQRNPVAGDREALSTALGAAVHDFSGANDDLEDAIALLSLLDGYVAVSNTNVHLSAGLGKPVQVLVPFPAEWRWLAEGACSPWFPDIPVHRQCAEGDWAEALSRMRVDLERSLA